MKKIIYLFILLNSLLSFSQNTETSGYQLENFAPKSPEAAAFLKYGEYPVDLSTGVPNISIPLYTIDVGDYKLPISLDYHASGIKVNQQSSWVGLGWNLSYGAQIILDTRDAPDEYNPAYFDLPNSNDVSNYIENNPLGYFHSFFQNLKQFSWIRDVYNFSSPTASGKFIIDGTSLSEHITVYPPDAFKVELLGGVTTRRFRITDAYGNIYFFDNTKEFSQTLQQYQPPLYTSAWFVDKIETKNHKLIEFFYEDGGDVVDVNYSENINHNKLLIPNYNCIYDAVPHKETLSSITTNLNNLYTSTKKISRIEFERGKVSFNTSSGRLDYYNLNDITSLTNGPKKLDNIEIQAKDNLSNDYITIKDYHFDYTYP